MSPLLLPFRLVLLVAGWVNRHQLDVIEYLQEENRLLKERLGGRRLRFTRRVTFVYRVKSEETRSVRLRLKAKLSSGTFGS
jgi:hypothetical protein